MVQIRPLIFCVAAALSAGGCVSGSIDTDGNGDPSSTGSTSGGTIVRNGSAKCLGIVGGATADSSKADQYTCNGSVAQNWSLQSSATAGQVTIVNALSSKCLDIKSAGTANGTQIQLYSCNGTAAQVWVAEDQGNGYSQLRNPSSNRCVDVVGASSADSANVELYDCNGSAAQQWKINGTSSTAGGGGTGGGGTAGGGGGTAGGGGGTGTAPSTFVHPGVMVDQAQLDFVKAQIAAKKDPWYSAFNSVKGNSLGSLNYTPHPYADVECGSASMNPSVGCSDEKNDSAAAYTQALLYYYTGNTAYADKAIQIMNAWSAVLTKHGASNAPLQSAWSASQWPRAAEIIKWTYSKWSQTDQQAFAKMLTNVYLPETVNGSNSNGNWELAMIEANIGIAVFTDDHTGFNNAVAMWKKRVPAYIYLTTDGPTPVPPETGDKNSASALNGFWYNAPAYVNGLAQETCRDLGHVQYGFASATNVAETARIQGVDLYSLEKTRLAAGYEFHAQFINGSTANTSSVCGSHTLVSVSADAMWEIGYNALNGRLGIALPQSLKVIDQIRPTWQDHMMAWETLTHAGTGNVGIK
jgi:Ricin-type beta-trefoil lectin domain-like/Alginate lyase